MLKLSIILGTRPEIIKCSPIIREFEKRELNYFILHTGQHYSYNMDKVFFEQLRLPLPTYNLDVGSGTHGKQTGKMLIGIEDILQKQSPDVVLVQGDTNTVLAGSIAATKLQIKVGHIEAGLRSYDHQMPEETNRVLADHCSDYLFAPTEKSKQILLHEGIEERKIFTVGNTVVDAVSQNLEIAKAKNNALHHFGVKQGQYILATSHRQENVDDKTKFIGLMQGLKKVQKEFQMPLIYPIHPRAKKQIETFHIDTQNLTLIEPLDYLTFLQLENYANLVLTDSGGVQEETCILKVPCVTLRENTERPETIEVGANSLAGTNPEKIANGAKTMTKKRRNWKNPFGDGKTAQRITDTLIKELS
jgi:UDP-N-acetylglucosamine 2-epimerase (non-hydrolysing)